MFFTHVIRHYACYESESFFSGTTGSIYWTVLMVIFCIGTCALCTLGALVYAATYHGDFYNMVIGTLSGWKTSEKETDDSAAVV